MKPIIIDDPFYHPTPEPGDSPTATVPLEQIVKEYSEAIGSEMGSKPVRWSGEMGTIEDVHFLNTRHDKGKAQIRKPLSKQQKQAKRAERVRERRARKAGR